MDGQPKLAKYKGMIRVIILEVLTINMDIRYVGLSELGLGSNNRS